MHFIFRSNIALDYVCLLDGMILFSSLTVLIVWLTEKHSTQNNKTGMDFYTRYTRCIYRWERTLLKIVGHDILGDEFKKNILSYFVYFLICFTISNQLYSFIYFDSKTKIFMLHCIFMAIQVCVNDDSQSINLYANISITNSILTLFFKYFSQFLAKVYTLLNAGDFQWTTSCIQKLYQIHVKTESKDRRDFFEFFSFVTEYSFKLLMTCYTLSYMVIMLYPAFIYFIVGKRELFIPLYIPGIDAETPIGYSFTLFYHFVLFSFSLAGWGGYDYLVGIIIISSPIFSKLITSDLNQMNVELSTDDRFERFNAICRFRNILLMQLEMKEYVEIIWLN